MKLIVDSGTSKTDWVAIDDKGSVLFSTQSLGLNPELLNEKQIIKILDDNLEIFQNKDNVSELFFYGAGCGSDRIKNILSKMFSVYFMNSKIVVLEDTYAAVYASTPKNEKAIVCILGTGSNCSYFDGEKLHQKIQSLGFIVMDDCSGNQFGRHLIRGYFYNKMPKNLAQEFEKEFNLDTNIVLHNLFKEPNPSAYLASFAKFMIKYKNTDFCKKYILFELENFIENQIKNYDNYKEVPVNFVGSIAYHLKDEIEEALTKHKIKLGNIIRRPIEGLITYHSLS